MGAVHASSHPAARAPCSCSITRTSHLSTHLMTHPMHVPSAEMPRSQSHIVHGLRAHSNRKAGNLAVEALLVAADTERVEVGYSILQLSAALESRLYIVAVCLLFFFFLKSWWSRCCCWQLASRSAGREVAACCSRGVLVE